MRFFGHKFAGFWPKVADNEQLRKKQCWKATSNFQPCFSFVLRVLGQKKFAQLAANERSWKNIAWKFSGKSRKNNLEKAKQFLEEQLVGQSPRSAHTVGF
jgi:hypothetical protein